MKKIYVPVVIIIFAVSVVISALNVFLILRKTASNVERSSTIEVPIQTEPAARTESGIDAALKKIPSTDKILGLQNIDDGRIVVLTAAVPNEEGWSPTSSLWIVSPDSASPKRITQHRLLGYFGRSVTWEVDGSAVRIRASYTGDGPYGWDDVISDDIDLKTETVIASTEWGSNFSPTWVLTIGDHEYAIKLVAANGCEKEYSDTATGISVNGEVYPFEKSVAIQCPEFGEGAPMPTMPGLGEPSFGQSSSIYGGDSVQFALPSGETASIDLDSGKLYSGNFPHDYQLPAPTSTKYSIE